MWNRKVRPTKRIREKKRLYIERVYKNNSIEVVRETKFPFFLTLSSNEQPVFTLIHISIWFSACWWVSLHVKKIHIAVNTHLRSHTKSVEVMRSRWNSVNTQSQIFQPVCRAGNHSANCINYELRISFATLNIQCIYYN